MRIMTSLCRMGLGALTLGALLVFQAPLQTTAASSAFTFTWAGSPASPQPWTPRPVNDWYLAKHDRDLTMTFARPYSMVAQHGSDCGKFQGYGVGGFHSVTTYADSAFICNNHMMTAVNGQGYGEIAFTPAQMVDFSQGTASITWHQSTLRTSCRDWLSFDLMPFADYLNFTDGIGVDLNGEARDEVNISTGANCKTAYTGQDIRGFNAAPIGGPGGAVEDVIPNSPEAGVNRARFELDVSRTHVRFGLPDFNLWMVDGNLSSPLPYSQAVIHIAQHSYTPDKQCDPTPISCEPDTWHWSDFAISNAVPFTILNADAFQVSHPDYGFPDTVNFVAPSPANSFLVMDAIAKPGTLQVSPDSGRSWTCVCQTQVAQQNPNGTFTDGAQNQIFMPIPAGVQSLKFRAEDAYWTPWIARDIAIFASTQTAVPPGNNPPAPPNTQPAAGGGAGSSQQEAGASASGTATGGGQPAARKKAGGSNGKHSGGQAPSLITQPGAFAGTLARQPGVLLALAGAILLLLLGALTAMWRTGRLGKRRT